MDAILGASIIASFIAGMVALFAPCCVTVLLPAYLGSVFKERKKIVGMTFVFFLGISVVIIPIGLGAAGLAQFFRDFHKEMYVIGGAFMVILGGMTLFGKSLPFMPQKKSVQAIPGAVNSKSVFMLGVFSGAATSCCAPVLAGAVTLAALSGAFWKALVVTFAYVFGMTFPLFILAYFYDRFGLQKVNIFKGRDIKLKVLGTHFRASVTSVLASVIFVGMGVVLLWLGLTNNAFWSPTMQATVGEELNHWSIQLVDKLSLVPDLVWGLIIIGLFTFFTLKSEKVELISNLWKKITKQKNQNQ